MPEILTESFCERCGTRYTFESARRRVRLKRVKVLTKGVKNFILSDSTSIDEAMASARAETDREVTTNQLDAFHQTFTFCMSCRQYTCSNCWNTADARCLSCAPLARAEAVPADEPAAAVLAALDVAQPTPVHSTNGSNGHDAAADAVVVADARGDAVGQADADGEATVEPDTALQSHADAEPGALADTELAGGSELAADVELAGVAAEPEAVAEPAPVAAEPTAIAEPAANPGIAAAASALTAGAVVLSRKTAEVGKRTASQTTDLLRRFRPGQNIDAELEAYERERAAALAAASMASAVRAPAESEPSAAVPTAAEAHVPESTAPTKPPAAPDAAATTATPERSIPTMPAAATPAFAATAPTVPTPPPATPKPKSAPPPKVEDLVVQPTWQRVAPDTGQEQPSVTPSLPAAASADDSESPKWPAKPEWPTGTRSTGLPFLGRPAVPDSGFDGIWAASAREVITTPRVPGKPANAVQPCVSCGLSLSATARFCRRCGAAQG